jgi:hypothetical protein
MFSQFASLIPAFSSKDIQKITCEKTGTIYYKNMKTGETAWKIEDLKKNPSLTKK